MERRCRDRDVKGSVGQAGVLERGNFHLKIGVRQHSQQNAASVGFGSTPVTAAPREGAVGHESGPWPDLQHTRAVAQMAPVAQYLVHPLGILRSPAHVRDWILSV